jgi:hypothetical protein
MIPAHIRAHTVQPDARQALEQAEANLAAAEIVAEDSAALTSPGVGVWATPYVDALERLDKAIWQVRHKRHVLAGLERLLAERDAHLAQVAAMQAAEQEAATTKAAKEAADAAKALAERDAKADRAFVEIMCVGLSPKDAELRLAKHRAERQAKREAVARDAALRAAQEARPAHISSCAGY